MDQRDEIREFLASRRARITPQQAGLPIYGGNRPVPGLRREEVAPLAGMSVDYYTQMERATCTASPTASWMPSPGRCSWMGPNRPTCSIWPVPPPPRPARGGQAAPSGSGPASSGS